MTTQGLWIFLIFLFSVILIVVFNKKIRVLLRSEWFWKISSFAIVSYIIFGRMLWEWIDGYWQGIFLTDFCPFAAVVVTALAFSKKTRRVSEAFAIWLILTSLVTSFEFYISETKENFFKWFFYGAEFGPKGVGVGTIAPLFIIMHYLNLIYGILLILNKSFDRLKWTYALENSLAMILYLVYVFIIKTIFNLEHNITGLGNFDWEYGQYSTATEVLNLPYPTVLYVGFTIMALVNWSCVGLTFYWKHLVIKHKWNNFWI